MSSRKAVPFYIPSERNSVLDFTYTLGIMDLLFNGPFFFSFFEIIVNSHAVVRDNAGKLLVPFAQFPPVETVRKSRG